MLECKIKTIKQRLAYLNDKTMYLNLWLSWPYT